MESIADFLARTAREKQQRDAAAAGVVIGSVEKSPDEVAGNMALAQDWAKTTGKPQPPLPMVEEYRSVFQKQIEDKRNSTILADAPKLSEWLKNPENAALSRDDLSGLSWWERVSKSFRMGEATAITQGQEFTRDIGSALERGPLGRGLDALGEGFDRTVLSNEDGSPNLLGRLANWARGQGMAEDGMPRQMVGGPDVTPDQRAEAIAAMDLGPLYQGASSLLKEMEKAGFAPMSYKDVRGVGSALSFISENLAMSLPQMAAAMTSGQFSPLIQVITLGGEANAELKERTDLSNDQRVAVATGAGTVMAALDYFGLSRVFGGLGAGKVATEAVEGTLVNRLVQSGLSEAAGRTLQAAIAEGTTEALQEAVVMGVTALSGGAYEAGEVIDRFLQSFTAGAASGGALRAGGEAVTGAGAAARRMTEGEGKAQAAVDAQATIAEIAGQSAASKLRARMPDVFRAWVERATEGGKAESLYVPADKFTEYFQSIGMDPFALADEMEGVTRADLEAALETGGDLRIPTATYAAKLAGSEADALFMENMRFDPDDFTSAEARAFEETKAELMAEAWAEAERTFAEQQELRTFEREIYDTMVERLRMAGRATDVATTEAMLYPAFYRVMAERSGMTTQEFMQRYPLPQVRGDIPQGIQPKNVDDLTRTLATARAARQAGVNQPQTPLLEWIASRGGIDDTGGELVARNAAEIKRGRGRKTLRLARSLDAEGKPTATAEELASGKRFGWDDVAQAAVEAGFMAGDPRVIEWQNAQRDGTVAPDLIPALMEAIDAELRGDAQLTMDEMTAGPSQDEMLADLERYLAEINVSLDDDDATIRAAIERDQAERGRAYAQFAGPQSETADIHALARAKDMIAKGESPEQVRRETGWFRGPDMKWRYEITDEDAVLVGGDRSDLFTAEDGTAFQLQDIMDHDRLFAAYPDLKLIPVTVDNSIKAWGQVDGYGAEMRLNVRRIKAEGGDVLSIILHEIQHLIQRREGFARGGNQDMAPGVKSALQRLVQAKDGEVARFENENGMLFRQADEARRMLGYAQMFQDFDRLIEYARMDRPSGVFRHIRNATGWFYTPVIQENADLRAKANDLQRSLYALPRSGAKRNTFLRQFSFDLAQLLREAVPPARWELLKNDPRKTTSMLKALEREAAKASERIKPHWELTKDARLAKSQADANAYRSPFEIYQLLAGEVEARNTQNRASMTEAERRATPPEATMTVDVPGGGNIGSDWTFTNDDGKRRISIEDVIVVMQTGEIDTPFIANMEAPEGRTYGQSAAPKMVDVDGIELPVNPDGTVTLYHGTTAAAADQIMQTGLLRSAAEPSVYLTTAMTPDTGYGDGTVLAIDVRPDLLRLDDEFPDGRAYFAIDRSAVRIVRSRIVAGGTGKTYDQPAYHDAPRLFEQEQRGSIAFPGAGVGRGETVVSLFRKADLSTFVHESGHYFLTVMQDMAARGEQSAVLEFETVKNWWRTNAQAVAKDAMRVMPDVAVTADDVIRAIDGGTTGDVMKDAAIDVGMQEQFARGFEAYLMEGTAPSVELRGAFEKFRAWLVAVYRRLTGLNVEVSDDIRRVFDRLLATDDEIAAARAKTGDTGPMFKAGENPGLSPEDFERYQRIAQQAQDEAAARLLAETMAPIKREAEAAYRAEKDAVRAEVEPQVNARREYRAIEWMGNRRWLGGEKPMGLPDMRLSRRMLVDRYGEGVLKTLPRGTFTLYTNQGGVDPEIAAGLFGFGSADEMIRALERAPKRADAIAAEVERVMFERHGDPLRDGTVEAKAIEAVHGDKRARMLALELDILNAKPGGTKSAVSVFREMARGTLARMPVRDAMAANRYLTAERKAGEASYRAFSNGDLAGAAEAKRRQLLNHMLYAEAKKIEAEVETAEKLAARLQKKSTRDKLAGDYLEAIDEILNRYDFRRLSGRAEERRGALLAYVERMKAEGRENELAIPDRVLQDAARIPYKRLSVEHLRGVVDALKNIEHTARLKQKLIDAQSQRELDAVVDDILGAFDANIKERPPGRVGTTGEKLRTGARQFLDLVLNSTTILREIDGFKDLGAAYANMKAPIDEAMNRLQVRREKAAIDLDALYEVYTKAERRQMAVREFISEIGASLSKWERISVALNMGNEGNYQRLTDTKVRGGFTEAQVKAIVAGLDARDARFVQSVWDYLDTFRPDIEAREKRVTGVAPKWVEGRPVTIAGIDLKGGYYPLKYDARLSAMSRDDAAQDIANSLQAGRFGKAQTRNGHLKERATSSGRPVELDISVLHRHVQQVVYDLELSEPVSNSWRILQDGRIRDAFINAGKQADFDALEIWLKDVAEGELRSADVAGRMARRFKSNFTAAKLAFNLSTVALQITGVAQSMVVVGKADFLRGVQASLRRGVREEVFAKSQFMRERSTTFNKDIFDLYNDPRMGPVATRWQEVRNDWIAPAGFWLMTKVQSFLVDVPTWLAGYQQGLRMFGGDEAKAIAHADGIVKRAQASGLFSDRSAIERGSANMRLRQNEFLRLFTTLGSYMFAKFNVAYERTGRARQVIEAEGVSLRSAQEALSWTIDVAFLFTLEAVLFAAIKGGLPDEEDDEDRDGMADEWAAFLAKQTGLSFIGTIPFVRDLGSVLTGFGGGGAYGAITEELARPLVQMGQGEVDMPLVKSVINATGLFLGLPSGQINRMVDAGWRQAEGEEVSPVEYLLGRMAQ